MTPRTPAPMAESIRLVVSEGIARVTLARPEARNAFNAETIEQLHDVFARITAADDVRAVVLAGEGKVFCGGADIGWMRESLELSFDANVADAERMSDMFRTIDNCPKPVIGQIHGAALGGGAGLAAVCDIAIAADDAMFGFTEVKLGIIPAVISPFVLAKIGASHARALFLTGERFDARRAKHIGLVHEVVPAVELGAAVEHCLEELFTAGPAAVRAAKLLIRRVIDNDYDDSRAITARAIAQQRIGTEGQEGLRAFLERRQASFVKDLEREDPSV
ncbi:MAG TPA: enoyl-CoA hydratase-related protein [Candidatus Acidoferrum sp.]|jgi:methylglutaconyl-CoA hydratase|nr:enoyl-CoA hydratase-related protein [Candidatus Acidoferrum sp.]